MTLTWSQHALVLALLAVDAIARGLRLRALVPMPLARAVGVNICGDAVASLTPAGLGADPVRFAVCQRSGSKGSVLLAAFVTEFGVGALATAAGAAVLTGLFTGSTGDLARRLAALFEPTSSLRTWSLVVMVATAAGAIAGMWYRRRLPPALVAGVRDAWLAVRLHPPSLLLLVGSLTALSLAARTAVLPVLAAGVPGAKPGLLIVGSYMLLVVQTVLPTPAGAGGVELGFLSGFAGRLSVPATVSLLAVWRFYTLVLGLVASVILLTRSRWWRGRSGTPRAGVER